MRIYVQHVDSFIGRALLKELRKNGDIWNRMFGSLKDVKHSVKPKDVRRLVQLTDKRFVETLTSCKLIVLHLREDNNDELEFVLQTLKTAALEEPITYMMKAWKEYEERALAFNTDEASQVKAHVIGCGALFGGGECSHFQNVFRNAWLGNKPEELAKGDMPYVVCCDTARKTLTEIWQAIVNEMTEGYPLKLEPSEEAEDPSVVGMSDLTCVPTAILQSDAFPWVAPAGLTVPANARLAGEQYASSSNQQAVKILLFRDHPSEGPAPGSGADKAAEAERKAHEAACARYVSFLQEEYGIGAIKGFGEMASTNTTRYRGYVLEVRGELSYEKCRAEFLEEIEVEEVVEGGEEKKMVPKACMPEHAIALSWPKSDAKSFMDFYRTELDTQVLYLPPKGSAEEVEKQLESVRMFVDGTNKRPDGTVGRALNANMKPEKQVIEETLVKHEEAGHEINDVADDALDDDNLDEIRKKEPTKQDIRRGEKLEKLESRERALKQMSIADYVNENVVPTLTEGLIALCKLKPDGPIEYLADFLERAADEQMAEKD
eukprot:g13736.t1